MKESKSKFDYLRPFVLRTVGEYYNEGWKKIVSFQFRFATG